MSRPQFSIRSLLRLMLVVAVGCVIIPCAIQGYRRYQAEKDLRELVRLIGETVQPTEASSEWRRVEVEITREDRPDD